MSYAGTYDQAWIDHQFPLLPADFDFRFFQSVAVDQWIPRPRGGEYIAIEGMSADGPLHLALPPCEMRIGLRYRTHSEDRLMDLDTVFVEADVRRLTLTWRATADIHGDPFNLLDIEIGAAGAAQPPGGCGCEAL